MAYSAAGWMSRLSVIMQVSLTNQAEKPSDFKISSSPNLFQNS
jgi:hypothetical protein